MSCGHNPSSDPIASVTTRVTVKTSTNPVVVDPPDLASLTLASVGLDNEDAAAFKANLDPLISNFNLGTDGRNGDPG